MLKHVKFTSLVAILVAAFVYCTALFAEECPNLTGPSSTYDKSKWIIIPVSIYTLPENISFVGATWNIVPKGIGCTYSFPSSSPFFNHFSLLSSNILTGPAPIVPGSKWVINILAETGTCKSNNYADCPFTDF